MSDRNRNDFDFDDDDLFRDDDAFDGDDELPGAIGDDFDSDMPVIEPDGQQRGGNRTFIILAALMIILFLVGLAVVLFLALREQPPSPAQLTASAVVQTNVAIAEFANQTATQSVIFANQTATQDALNLAATQTRLAITNTPTPTATNTPEPTIDPTSAAATQFFLGTQQAQTAQALAAEQTATALAQPTATPVEVVVVQTVEPSPTREGVIGPDLSSINQTATAIAAGFQTATAAALPPTEQPPTAEAGFTPIPRATALPETGLFDDIAGGGGRDGLGLLALAVVGLLGVIVISRRLRSGSRPDSSDSSSNSDQA